MAYITLPDLALFAEIPDDKAGAMIEDAVAQAILAAPCLGDESALDENQRAAVKAVLRGAILRWNDSGTGAFQQETMGPFSVSHDTRQTRRSLFWPSEIAQLEAICKAATGSGTTSAFSLNTAPGRSVHHAQTCSVVFGAAYCDCGSVLNGGHGPIFGGG